VLKDLLGIYLFTQSPIQHSMPLAKDHSDEHKPYVRRWQI